MSTGANCTFKEKAPGEWYYRIQQYPYGETEQYDEYGPFPTLEAGEAHLQNHHANPGGYGVIRFKK